MYADVIFHGDGDRTVRIYENEGGDSLWMNPEEFNQWARCISEELKTGDESPRTITYYAGDYTS